MAATFLIALIIGGVVGIASGLLGIGGGSVMLPIFRLVFGMSPVGSTATSLFTIIPTSLSGAVSHFREKTCVPKLGVALGIGGACTSPLGAWLANVSPGWAVMVAAALVIFYSATTMLRKALSIPKSAQGERYGDGDGDGERGKASDASARRGDVPQEPAQTVRPNALSLADYAKGAAIGATAGLASGYVGLGGGFLMVPLMLSLLNMPMKLASGTSLIAIIILATPATVVQCVLGNVDYLVGIAVACGSIPGAYFGARLTSRIPERNLRLGFAVFLGFAAAMLVVKELGLLG